MLNVLLAFTCPIFLTPQTDSTSSCLRMEENMFLQAALGSTGMSERYLDSLLSCGGDGPAALLAAARFHVEHEEFDRAQKVLDRLLAMPDLPDAVIGEAHYSAAVNAFYLKRYEVCIDHARKAAERNFYPAWSYNTVGLAYDRMNDRDRARAAYEQAMALDPSYARAYGNIAKGLAREKKYQQAFTMYHKADSLAAHTVADYATGMTRAVRDLDRDDLEAAWAEKAFRNFPDDRDVILDLINVRDEQERYTEIRPLLQKLLALRASSTDDLFGIAKAYNSLGQLDSSIYYYRQSIKLDARNSGAHLNLGIMYGDLGMFDQAHEHFDRALEIDPSNYRLYMSKASTCNWQFDFQRAYEWSLEYDKRLPNGRRNGLGIGYALMQLHRFKEAVPYLEDALLQKPGDDRALNNLGRCYTMLGDMPRARQYFEQAEAAEPRNAFVFHNRAAYHLLLGDTANACADLRKAMDLEYNWIIDSALIDMARTNCPDISLERRVLIHEYRGNVKELRGRRFIERFMTDDLLAPLPEIPLDTASKSMSTSISNRNDVHIAPNPASDKFVLVLGEGMLGADISVKLFDMKGTAVMGQRAIGPRSVIDVSSLQPGAYVVMLSDDHSVRATSKLIVAR